MSKSRALVRNVDAPRKGFEMIPNRATHLYLTIDNQQRLYVPALTRELLGLPRGGFKLLAGYDHDFDRIVLYKVKGGFRKADVYKFDKRSYSRVKYFVERAQIADKLPLQYLYVKNDDPKRYGKDAYVFQIDAFYDGDKEDEA